MAVEMGFKIVFFLFFLQKKTKTSKVQILCFFFNALHGMQTRSSDEKTVRPSVCLSVRLSNAWIVIKRKKNLSLRYHRTVPLENRKSADFRLKSHFA